MIGSTVHFRCFLTCTIFCQEQSIDLLLACWIVWCAGFGSNGIHVTPLLYSVTIWLFSVVLEYISETVFTQVFSYILATVLIIVIDYIFYWRVIKVLILLDYNDYFSFVKCMQNGAFKASLSCVALWKSCFKCCMSFLIV